ncbi:hypothetical protein, partial [Lentilactobacillus kisonensis]|uniref:hypothetical protein n=1 Tax=Lentilactobacillus kisonensis TaxID=481722 RepID=UPI001F1E629D
VLHFNFKSRKKNKIIGVGINRFGLRLLPGMKFLILTQLNPPFMVFMMMDLSKVTEKIRQVCVFMI